MSYIINKSLWLLIRILLIIIVLFGFFVKDLGENNFLGFSPAAISLICLSISISILLFYKLVKKLKFTLNYFIIIPLLFFLTLFFVIFINFLFEKNIDLLYFYLIEVVSMALFFLLGYLIFDSLNFEIEYTFLIGIVVLLSITFLLSNLDLAIIRRIETAGGVNFIANNYAIALILFVNGFFVNKNKIYYFLLIFISLLLVFFMASKQAILVAFAGSFYVVYFHFSKIKLFKFLIGFFFVLTITIGYLNTIFDIELLLNRFSSDGIARSFNERFFLIKEMFYKIDFTSFFIGNQKINHLYDENFDNPHNIFLAVFLYFGFFSFSFLILSFVQIFLYYKHFNNRKHIFKNSSKFRVFILLLIFLFSAIIYLSVSGHFTRGYHFFFFWGSVIKSIHILQNTKNLYYK
jgi:hypothetical protein